MKKKKGNKHAMDKDDKIVKFDIFKIERNRTKICTCTPPQITVDPVNRNCICDKCGAIFDGFDGLMKMLEYIEVLDDALEKIRKNAKMWEEQAEREKRRCFKNSAFKEMEKHYLKENMLPYCPNCKEQFDPAKINRWGRNDIKMR